MMIFSDRKKRSKSVQWYIIGPVSGILLIALLLYAGATLLSHEIIPSDLLDEAAIVAVFLGTAAAAVIAAKRRGRGTLMAGSAVGLACFAVILLATILMPEGRLFSDGTVRMLISSLGGGAFGGALCIRRGGKTHKKRPVRK